MKFDRYNLKTRTTLYFSLAVLSFAVVIGFRTITSTVSAATTLIPETSQSVTTTTTTSMDTLPPGVTIENINVEPRGDFVLEPGKQEIVLDPGQSITKNISVTSRIATSTTFKVIVEDFKGSQDEDQPIVLLPGDDDPNSASRYYTPAIKQFTLTLGQKITIPVTITIPANAEPGGYYSSVLVSNEPTVSAQGNTATTKVISQVGTLFFVKVNGPVKESGHVEGFSIKDGGGVFTGPGSMAFQILYNNDGNIYLVPSGEIKITNLFGKEIDELPVDGYFALPQSLRYRNITWDRPFLFGCYTATLTMDLGYGNNIATKSVSFWVIPWKLIAIILGGAIVLFFIIWFITRKFEIKRK